MATRTQLPPDAQALARAHRLRQQQIAMAATQQTAKLWAYLDTANLAGSWAGLAPRILQLVTAALLEASRGSQDYVSAAVRMWGADPDPAGQVAEWTFAQTASDGRPLDTLLAQPALEAQAFVDQGMDQRQAKTIGQRHLDRIVATQVADAARVPTGVAQVNDRAVRGWIRMLQPPSCSRCVVLAGKFYATNAGFERHPQCFPAGVAVSGPQTLAASRRWYEGELVVLATASGQQLSLTGNHPVLTRRGWVPANLLQEGDEVVRSAHTKGATPLVVPDHQQMPALIEDVWRALGVGGLHRMPTAAEDFHGDGQDGEVDVVYADRALGRVPHPTFVQQSSESALTVRRELARLFDVQRAPVLVDAGHAAQSTGGMGRFGLTLPFLGSHAGGAHLAGGTRVTARDAMLGEAALDDIAAHAVLAAEGVLAGASEVGGGDRLDRQHLVAPRWDAPAGPLTVESRGAYAGRGLDLLERLAGQVELDRLVDVRRVEWSGHVYSLTSVEGWHGANSLIVSNCDCVHIPAAEHIPDLATDPKAYFDSLDEPEQNRIFTIAGARAIRDGADIGQVVNARRGATGIGYAAGRLTDAERTMLRGGRKRGRLDTIRVNGRDVFATTEASTTRGVAGVRLGAKETGKKTAGSRYRRAQIPRLMPESIYSEAERLGWSRDEIIRQLKRFGYVL